MWWENEVETVMGVICRGCSGRSLIRVGREVVMLGVGLIFWLCWEILEGLLESARWRWEVVIVCDLCRCCQYMLLLGKCFF